ncbi:hypothetical protein [uncultured Paracoccus sp.]|uniref:hypothetical protein n=1 Tax=uncultured Paracoccus sp. TaxID=189685 RepID=UPI0025F0DECB|nr:hypothetical protein [uncultured Paracoccus sp.]
MRAFGLAIATTLLAAGAVSAATLTEGSTDFSGNWKAPTIVAAGVDQISGSWGWQNDYDILGFTSLKPGAQTVTLTFSPKTPIGDKDWSFSAGGKLYYQTYAPKYSAWEGVQFGAVGIHHSNRNGDFTYDLKLGKDFAGVLYLGLYGTHGSLNYNIDVPGNAQPAPVPLPAGAALLPAGLAALAFLRRRKAR